MSKSSILLALALAFLCATAPALYFGMALASALGSFAAMAVPPFACLAIGAVLGHRAECALGDE